LAVLIGTMAGWSGVGTGLERGLAEARYGLRQHNANSDVAIVEIDARSISGIDRWPWPRRNYAEVVDRLRQAQVASIAFDVDFSSPSNPIDDHAFAHALARADGLVTLPTFRQAADNTRTGYIDSLPIPALREHTLAATVSVLPDPDGKVRNAPLGEITDGVPRPSLSAMVAARDGRVGVDFPIDYALDPSSIPRFSFIDVRDGRINPALLRGKRILIGATAIEVGDRYAVPRYGVIPGVVIQALAAVTLERGVPARAGWIAPIVLSLLSALALLRVRTGRWLIIGSIIASAFVFGCATVASVFGWEAQIVPALLSLYTIVICSAAAQVNAWLTKRRALDDATGLPNQHALAEALRSRTGVGVTAVRIAEYDRMLATLGDRAIADLICRLRDRVSVIGGGIDVYRVADRVLAWETSANADQCAARHERLRALMLTPMEVGGRKVDVGLASGMASVSGGDEYEAIANASMAADLALSEGTGWHVHEASDAAAADTELSLASEVDEAVEAGEIYPLYQPKLDLRSGAIVSVEALVRWNHTRHGMLRPDYFIPMLERADRIDGLTLHIVKCAIRDIEQWRAAGIHLTVAVNLSAILLESSAFIDQLELLLRSSEIDPHFLTFEVTESAAMHAPEAAAAALMKFKQLGVAISMDDYGTGQSTLTYLKKLPLDELKIDRSFVEFAHQNRGDAVLVRSTIDLAHDLGLKVVAEGVETNECQDFLQSVGCDLIQGYLISPPISAKAIVEFVRNDAKAGADVPESGPVMFRAVATH
jgi:EAL domain-containing protein (putative c-di-GMP-specific phosphodiesterase class I)/CHASE2 domain-containing sensor protein